jgi:hypothetical protein
MKKEIKKKRWWVGWVGDRGGGVRESRTNLCVKERKKGTRVSYRCAWLRSRRVFSELLLLLLLLLLSVEFILLEYTVKKTRPEMSFIGRETFECFTPIVDTSSKVFRHFVISLLHFLNHI